MGKGISRCLDAVLVTIAVSVLATSATALAMDNVELWRFVTRLGEEEAYMVIAIAVYTLMSPHLGVELMATLALSGALNLFLKNLLKMPRPPPSLWRYPASGYGFPSGHTQVSTTFWSFVAMHFRRAGVSSLAVSIPVSVALSRVALNVHYPLDVIGGMLIGLAVAAVTYTYFRVLGFARGYALHGLLLSLVVLSYALASLNQTASKLGGVILGTCVYPLLLTRGYVDVYLLSKLSVKLLGLVSALAIAYGVGRISNAVLTTAPSLLGIVCAYLLYALMTICVILLPPVLALIIKRL
ncbi:MAG: hypothetical protein DRO12_00900 [Thermoprotei archaeon]|nr:MAG: hypothetical protein DRO12_00900 [Thermoprotei archaeon]